MVFNILRGNKKKDLEKRFTTFSEQLAQAFAQIKTDISETNDRLESNQREMERISQWIDYLNRSNQRISEAHSKLLQKHEKITENSLKLHSSHRDLDSSHSRTAKMAENLENRHKELSSAILAHKSSLKSEFNEQIQEHKEAYEQEINRLKSWIDYFSTHLERQKSKEGNLKQDIEKNTREWLEAYSKLRELLNGLKSENSELKSSLSAVSNELAETRNELENTKDLARSHITEAKSELSKQIQAIKPAVQQPLPPPQPIVQEVSPTVSSFQRHIMSRVMPNRKGYVLKFILDLAKESKYSTKEVEEIVVNEKQLCGRTSFYAYLKELKLRGKLSYADIDERTIIVSTDTQQRLVE
jgi:chromosome segregation ATPase